MNDEDVIPEYLQALDAGIECLAAYTSGLVPDASEMTEEDFMLWSEFAMAGLLAIAGNLIGWVAKLANREPGQVQADLARIISERRFMENEWPA